MEYDQVKGGIRMNSQAIKLAGNGLDHDGKAVRVSIAKQCKKRACGDFGSIVRVGALFTTC